MKIDEFVRKANRNSEIGADDNDGVISICADTGDLLIDVPVDATNFLEVNWYNVKPVNYFSKHTREYLSALIDEFLQTPIDERFPEKKYRLRWIDEDDGDRNYLVTTSGWYLTNIIDDKKAVFTESELEQLKRDAPRLAPAIDAMKEPVEEEQ